MSLENYTKDVLKNILQGNTNLNFSKHFMNVYINRNRTVYDGNF